VRLAQVAAVVLLVIHLVLVLKGCLGGLLGRRLGLGRRLLGRASVIVCLLVALAVAATLQRAKLARLVLGGDALAATLGLFDLISSLIRHNHGGLALLGRSCRLLGGNLSVLGAQLKLVQAVVSGHALDKLVAALLDQVADGSLNLGEGHFLFDAE